MLNVQKMIESAEEALGWPYESPGTNDSRGIDCSGLFVKIFRDQGGSIYHGSNTIYREHCSETGKFTSISQLQPGMAVFKYKTWTDTEKDQRNRWYKKPPGNLSHIGLVVSVNPFKVIHASSAGCVMIDTKLSKWQYYGKLKNVDYDGFNINGGGTMSEIVEVYAAKVIGGTLNLRASKSTKADRIEQIPNGAEVTVLKEEDNWCKVLYNGKSGFVLKKYLEKIITEISPVNNGDYVYISRQELEKAYDILGDLLGLRG